MIVMKRIVPFILLILSLQKVQGYLDQHGVPKEGIGGYRGFGKNAWCLITFDWSREKTMLAAFDNVLKTNSAEDLKTFKDKFYPEDCGRHPRLVQQALENNRLDLIEFMKEKGLNIKSTFQEHCVDKAEQKTEFLKHPLHAIVQNYGDKGLALVALLLKLGFDPKQKDDQGNTLLHKAAKNKSVQMIKLLKVSVDINEKNNETKTSFLVALDSGNQTIIDELIAQGAKSCLKDAKGNTPVHEMAVHHSPAALKALEELAKTKDFDPNVENAEGETPLFIATKNKNEKGVAFLVAKGAKTNHKNKQQDTPLHIAAHLQPPSAYEALFEELLESEDFDPAIVDAQGKRVVDINNEQEEYYCNPKVQNFSSEKELDDHFYECKIIRDIRKKKVAKRRALINITIDRQLTEEKAAEKLLKLSEEKEIYNADKQKYHNVVQECDQSMEKIVQTKQEALLGEKISEEKNEAVDLQVEEVIQTKYVEHENKKAKTMKFFDDNN